MIGWLLVAPLSLCAAARAARLEESSSLLLLATGLTPLLGPPALVALGIGLWQRRWPLAVVSAAMAAAHLSSALFGLGVPARDPAPAGKPAALRLFSANVHHANRDLGRIGQEIRAAAPDLVALQEVDPDGAASLQRSGVLARFPYAVTELRTSPSGIGLWSLLPVADSRVQDLHGMAVITATILVGDHRLRLYTVHTVAPLGDDRARWRDQLRWVEEEIRRERRPVAAAIPAAPGPCPRLAGHRRAIGQGGPRPGQRPPADRRRARLAVGGGCPTLNGRISGAGRRFATR